MRITWYGHAAFLIETGGLRVILDPYRSPDCGGYEPIDEPADVVVVSHENDRYHSHLGQIVPPWSHPALDIPPEGEPPGSVRASTSSSARLPEDEVTIVHFRPRVHVVFLGDLGTRDRTNSPRRRAESSSAARRPTIDFPDIPPLLDAIGPRLFVPMHYKTPRSIEDPARRAVPEGLPGVPVDRPVGAARRQPTRRFRSSPDCGLDRARCRFLGRRARRG